MKITEVNMNLITVPQGWYIAHAISADLNFKVGLPAVMDRVYHIEQRMKKIFDEDEIKPGYTFQLGNLFNLVVKDSTYDAPDIDSLMDALVGMRDYLEDEEADRLAIPKLCCGRNGLEWEEVLETIKFVFEDSDIEIMVCIQ